MKNQVEYYLRLASQDLLHRLYRDILSSTSCIMISWEWERYSVYQFIMALSNGNISAILYLCDGNPPVTGGFPSQRPVARSVAVFFDLRMSTQLSKQSRRRWFETPSRSLWRHCNVQSFPMCYGLLHTQKLTHSVRNLLFGCSLKPTDFTHAAFFSTNVNPVLPVSGRCWPFCKKNV